MRDADGDTLTGHRADTVPNLSGPVDLAEKEAFRRDFLSDEMAVRTALMAMEDQMRSQGLPEDVIGDLNVVLAEALNNVVEHAHAGRDDGHVELAIFVRPCCIRCKIFDNGAPMPGLELPAGILPTHDTAFEDLPEGGFGWFLIRNMTADLVYDRTPDGNCLQFHIPLAADR